MSVISIHDFQKQYGPGRPPCAGSPNYTPEADIRVLTALADHFGVKRCLEIGCNSGVTSAAILAGNKTIEAYIGVDLAPGKTWYLRAGETPGCYALADPRFRLIQFEHGSRDILDGDIEPCDFVFIDGAHDYESVKYDTALAHALLAPGGIIAWHDYQNPQNMDVTKLIHEINDKPGVPEIVWVKSTWTCYKIMEQPDKKSDEQITAALDVAHPSQKEEKPNEPKKRNRRAKQPDAEPASPVC